LPEFLFGLICDSRFPEGATMPATNSVDTQSRPILVALLAGAGSLAIALSVGLWAYYGTAVFFEMVRAGWAACF
jgi:hypothetical protein